MIKVMARRGRNLQREGKRRNRIIYAAGFALIAGILWGYVHIAAAHQEYGPPPGLHIVSASWAGAALTQDCRHAGKDMDVELANSEKSIVRLQRIDLVPTSTVQHATLGFCGELRTSPWSTVHSPPGPWIEWRGGRTFRLPSGLTLQPGVGIELQGSIDYYRTIPGGYAAQEAIGLPIVGLKLHYVEDGHPHVVTVLLKSPTGAGL